MSLHNKEFLGDLVATLKKDGEALVSGLGKFRIKDVKERQARNPKTGAVITVLAHKKISFRPSKKLKDAVL